MDPLALGHLFSLGLWGGLAMAEAVLELGARSPDELRAAARLHRRLDLVLELPLLACVLGTGVALALRAPSLSPLLGVKIAAGLVAIGANLVCVPLVVARARAVDDEAALLRLSRAIRWTGVGFPAALLALVIGVGWFA